MGTGKRRNQAQIARDRLRIADLYLQGHLQADIAEEVGVSQATVSRDLKALHQDWLDSALMDFNEAKARELARIDRLEREYWRAWGESCKDKESSLAEKSEAGQVGRSKTQMKREGQSGNPAFLAGVQWCIEQRCKVLGVYAAIKQEIAGAGGGPMQVRVIAIGGIDPDDDI